MAVITVTGVDGVARQFEKIAADAPQAEANAVNKAGRALGREHLRQLARDTGLSSGRLSAMGRNGIRATSATAGEPVYTIRTGPRALQIISLRARIAGSGVTYRLKGAQRTLAGAFIQERLKRGVGVAQRAGRPRLPIARLFAPETLADLTEGHMGELLAFGQGQLEKHLLDEIATVTRGAA